MTQLKITNAREILDTYTDAVTHIGEGRFTVRSQSGQGWYNINDSVDQITCDCPDFIKNGNPCKHITAVLIKTKQITIPPEVEHKTRRRYVVKWPEYTAAQRYEISYLEQITSEVLKGEMTSQRTGKRGRPRTAIKNLLFCAVLKLYHQMPLRVSQGLFLNALKEHKIDYMPGINAPSTFLMREETTQLLNEAIAKVTLPLAMLDDTFAIDASGFRSTCFNYYRKEKYEPERKNVWEKCHLIVGTKTKAIPAVIVTGGDAPDESRFPSLLEATCKAGFSVKKVFADKAYLSRNNYSIAASLGVDAIIPFKSNSRGRAAGVPTWHQKFIEWQTNPAWLEQNDYGLRQSAEADFSALKRKLGETIKSRDPVARRNEIMLKIFIYDVTRLIHVIFESEQKPDMHEYSDFCTNNPQLGLMNS